jgi:hypothetical protein
LDQGRTKELLAGSEQSEGGALAEVEGRSVVATGPRASSVASDAGSHPSGSAGVPPLPRTAKLPAGAPLRRAAQRSCISEEWTRSNHND